MSCMLSYVMCDTLLSRLTMEFIRFLILTRTAATDVREYMPYTLTHIIYLTKYIIYICVSSSHDTYYISINHSLYTLYLRENMIVIQLLYHYILITVLFLATRERMVSLALWAHSSLMITHPMHIILPYYNRDGDR